MTEEKKKAEAIVEKFTEYSCGELPEDQVENAKKCALIHVEGIIEENHLVDNDHLPVDETIAYLAGRLEFLQSVKEEIEKL